MTHQFQRLTVGSGALQADPIEALQCRTVAERHSIGDDVLHDGGKPADHCIGADPHELVYRRQPADDCAVLYRDMAAEGGVVRENAIAAYPAIMCDVRAHHEQVPVADDGAHAAAFRARIHGDMLADDVSGADLKRRWLAGIFQVLWRMADRCKGEDPGPGTDIRTPCQYDMGLQNTAVTELDFPADMAERPDFYAFAERRTLFDNGVRVYGARHHSPWIIALYSASATRIPSTLASPRNRHTAPRWRRTATSTRTWSPGTTGRRKRALSIVMK